MNLINSVRRLFMDLMVSCIICIRVSWLHLRQKANTYWLISRRLLSVSFVNEGLVDLDLRLSGQCGAVSNDENSYDIYQHQFQCITVCHAGAAFSLSTLHRQRPIHQILCHMETSHVKSFARDNSTTVVSSQQCTNQRVQSNWGNSMPFKSRRLYQELQ